MSAPVASAGGVRLGKENYMGISIKLEWSGLDEYLPRDQSYWSREIQRGSGVWSCDVEWSHGGPYLEKKK